MQRLPDGCQNLHVSANTLIPTPETAGPQLCWPPTL